MPFLFQKTNRQSIKISKASLRSEKRIPRTKRQKTLLTKEKERVSLFTSLKKASLTVETAMVLPIFLFAMISILSFGRVINQSDCVSQSLHQTAKEMARYSYAVKKLSNCKDLGNKISDIAMTETYVRTDVSRKIKENGGKVENISLIRSKIMEKDMIDLIAVEDVKLAYDFLGIGSFRIIDRARVHAFTGYDNAKLDGIDSSEEIVYITREGTVYHRDRSCRHLKITIETISRSSVSSKRNQDGGKYYPCEYCKSKQGKGPVYITTYGDRYHNSVQCSALKRDIQAVPISKVSGKPPCKTCGGTIGN